MGYGGDSGSGDFLYTDVGFLYLMWAFFISYGPLE